MKVYLAARYIKHELMRTVRNDLEALRYEVTSRWIEGTHEIADGGSVQGDDEARQRFALEDLEDLIAADLCISFTEEPRSTNSRGGRHVEFGMAFGMGKLVWVIGHRENVFHHLPEVAFYETWEAALGDLKEIARALEVGTKSEPALCDLLADGLSEVTS